MVSDNILETLARNAAGKETIMSAYRKIVLEIANEIKDHIQQDREGKGKKFEEGFDYCVKLVDEKVSQLTEV